MQPRRRGGRSTTALAAIAASPTTSSNGNHASDKVSCSSRRLTHQSTFFPVAQALQSLRQKYRSTGLLVLFRGCEDGCTYSLVGQVLLFLTK